MIYEFETKIRYSQTGSGGHLTLPAIVDFFQDAAIENANDVQKAAPPEEMSKLVWFLAAWQIDVFRYPECGEDVVIGTFPYRFGGSTGLRNVYLRTKDGEMLAYGDSTWVLMNRETGAMTRVPQWLAELFPAEEKLPMEYKGRRIDMPEQSETVRKITVREGHLDSNRHVNNGQYVRMAVAELPAGTEYKRLRVEYKKSAVLGDEIAVGVALEDSRHVVVLGEGADTYAVVELEP